MCMLRINKAHRVTEQALRWGCLINGGTGTAQSLLLTESKHMCLHPHCGHRGANLLPLRIRPVMVVQLTLAGIAASICEHFGVILFSFLSLVLWISSTSPGWEVDTSQVWWLLMIWTYFSVLCTQQPSMLQMLSMSVLFSCAKYRILNLEFCHSHHVPRIPIRFLLNIKKNDFFVLVKHSWKTSDNNS